MRCNLLRGSPSPIGLGDFEKAFPSVLLDGLWSLLVRLRAAFPLRTLLQNLYFNVQRFARGRNRQYYWGLSQRGLKTGCGLSTFLLLLPMFVLGVAFKQHLIRADPYAGIAFFADDFAWFSASWRAWLGLGAILVRAGRCLGLKVNWAKSLAVSAEPPDDETLAALLAEGWVMQCFV